MSRNGSFRCTRSSTATSRGTERPFRLSRHAKVSVTETSWRKRTRKRPKSNRLSVRCISLPSERKERSQGRNQGELGERREHECGKSQGARIRIPFSAGFTDFPQPGLHWQNSQRSFNHFTRFALTTLPRLVQRPASCLQRK